MSVDPLSLIGLGIEAIKTISNRVGPKIALKPNSIRFTKSDWESSKIVLITNKTDSHLFDVQIVLWTDNQLPSFHIEIEDQEKSHAERMGSVTVNTDSILIDGETNGKQFKLIELKELKPKISKKIYISSNQSLNIKLKAVNVSKKPSSLATKRGSIAIPFKPPFEMKVKAIYFLMKKK